MDNQEKIFIFPFFYIFPIKALFLVGFRFQPTDEELVGYFLFRKINGHLIIQDGKVKDIDVYQREPMELYGIDLKFCVCRCVYIDSITKISNSSYMFMK